MTKLVRTVMSAAAVLFLVLSGTNASSQNVRNERQVPLDLAAEAATAAMRRCRQDGFRISVVILAHCAAVSF